MSIPFVRSFLLAIPIVFSAFKTPWLELLLAQIYQNHLSSKVTSLASNSASNLFWMATLVHRSLHNAAPQYTSSLLHPYTSASLCLLQSPLPTSYQKCSRLSFFSTCWPFPLEFPASSSQIYRLLHCLQIQSKNSLSLRCKHLCPLAIYHELLIRVRHNSWFCVLKLYYVMLC